MKIYYDNGDLILLEKYKKIRLYHKNTIINFFKILFINKNYGSFSFFIIIIIECSLTTTTTTTSSSSSLAVVEVFFRGQKKSGDKLLPCYCKNYQSQPIKNSFSDVVARGNLAR